jgi:hypothetical protein
MVNDRGKYIIYSGNQLAPLGLTFSVWGLINLKGKGAEKRHGAK